MQPANTPPAKPPGLLDQVRERIRLKHRSVRTVTQSVRWVMGFFCTTASGQARDGALPRPRKRSRGFPGVRRAMAPDLVPPQDLNRIVELALDDLANLHEGNVSRYRLRLSEHRAWQPMQRDGVA